MKIFNDAPLSGRIECRVADCCEHVIVNMFHCLVSNDNLSKSGYVYARYDKRRDIVSLVYSQEYFDWLIENEYIEYHGIDFSRIHKANNGVDASSPDALDPDEMLTYEMYSLTDKGLAYCEENLEVIKTVRFKP